MTSSDILALNAGSSSLKFSLFEGDRGNELTLVCKGEIAGIGTAPHFRTVDQAGRSLAERRWPPNAALGHERFLSDLFTWIEDHRGDGRLAAAGHRVVHGGVAFSAPALVVDAVLVELDRLVPLIAPLHQPHNLAAIRALKALRPDLGRPLVGIVVDPIGFGLVDNLARPGGHFTGVSVDAGIEIGGNVSSS
jgi:acetate kinase